MGEEMAAAYGASDAVIVPSVYLDPFPTIVLEAMAAGTPVVASTFGGAQEAVVDGETGYVVDPRDTEEFAGKVLSLLKNPELAARMGMAGIQRVEKKFTAARMAADYAALYARLKR